MAIRSRSSVVIAVDDGPPTLPMTAPRRRSPSPDTLAAEAPRVLADRYELRRRLGSGGMADVYLAHDRMLRRDVAVKVLRPALASDPQIAQRFAREAMALAAVDAPNVVGIHDVVLGADTFLVLRYVTGRSLDALLALEAPLSLERSARLIVQILDGLIALHNRRLVHRDLKPANVIVDHGDRAVIIDLGVALDRRVPSLTPPGSIAGTPEFMAPEHLSGARVDPRSDLYQVGMVLVHAITGTDPAPIGGAQRSQLTVTLPSPYDGIAARALAASPQDRYPDAAAMRSDLLAALRPRSLRTSS
jgi:serine/threonine protein kinase